MGRKSREKGAYGERELARELSRLLGVEARRGCQYQGGPGRYERRRVGASAPRPEEAATKGTNVRMNPGEPDVMVDIPDVHIECKRTERLRLYEALQQAVDDAGGKVPVVVHRQNRKPWVAIVRLDDLPRLAVQVYLSMAENA